MRNFKKSVPKLLGGSELLAKEEVDDDEASRSSSDPDLKSTGLLRNELFTIGRSFVNSFDEVALTDDQRWR
mgnify:CR=1 FL=1